MPGLPCPGALGWLASTSPTIFHYCDSYGSCFRHFVLILSTNHEILIPQICYISVIYLFMNCGLLEGNLFVLPRTNVRPILRNHGLDQWKVFAGDWRVGGKFLGIQAPGPSLPDRSTCVPPAKATALAGWGWGFLSTSSHCLVSVDHSLPPLRPMAGNGSCSSLVLWIFIVLYCFSCFCPHLLKYPFIKFFTPS